ncbi:DUF5998 family protein [Naumannella halotolerans]|uniref:Phosphodiesterase n=1 Tax=Naumannella halotolerans TaxID=993414 RepID=A0A4R7J7I3_9ACTN|nr:DUF5998 family protein [Naumannella halotolerans]TDT33224.1 hypothetical protein CLV29_0829 [Naumannella halotolerans]
MTSLQPTDSRAALRAEIDACGYFPDLVEDAVVTALGDEPIEHFVVHHEPTFNRDEIRRHLTILVLTPTRLLVGHTDEQDGEGGRGQAASSTEVVGLHRIHSVTVTRVVAAPEDYRPGSPAVEAWLTVGWGVMNRVDLEPASCADPNCEADHGYTGAVTVEDLMVRVSAAADGPRPVKDLLTLGTALQQRAGTGAVRSISAGGR